ncbi:putative reverse transcriptase domain-containing protein [Tanacetum coccineum]
MRMARKSGAEDEDYVQRAMIHCEIETELPFKLHHYWEILKDRPKWQEIAIPTFNTGSEGGSKRIRSSGSSSFNTESREASINLNTNVGDNDKDEIMSSRMRTRSAGRPAAESLGGGTGERVGRGGRGRRHREGNDERVEDLNGQGNGTFYPPC